MGSFFKFGLVVPEIFQFQCSKNLVIFRQDLEGTWSRPGDLLTFSYFSEE